MHTNMISLTTVSPLLYMFVFFIEAQNVFEKHLIQIAKRLTWQHSVTRKLVEIIS